MLQAVTQADIINIVDEVEIKLTKYVSFYLQNCIIGNLKDSLYVEVSAINHLVIFKLSVAVRKKIQFIKKLRFM